MKVPAAGSAACQVPSPAGRRGSPEGGERAGRCRRTEATYRLSGETREKATGIKMKTRMVTQN